MHTIREYTRADVTDIERMLDEMRKFESLLSPERLERLESATDYLDWLLDKCERGHGKLFVAERDGAVIGMVAVFMEKDEQQHVIEVARYALITDLIAVPGETDGASVVGDLVSRAERYAHEQGVRKIMVKLLAGHKELLATYRRHGYGEYETILAKGLE